MEQAIHVVSNSSYACKHPWNHTQIWGGKQMKGLGCAMHIPLEISEPVLSGRNLCPPNKKAENHQFAASTPGSPNTSRGWRNIQKHAAWHQCFSRFSVVFSAGVWLLSLAQPTAAPCFGEGSTLWTHTQGSRAATHQRHCAHCLLCSILGQRASPLLCCRGPKQSPSKLPFCCILHPFSRCPLETANQWADFGPQTGVTGVRRMALPRRDAPLAQSCTSSPCKTLLMQDEGHSQSILSQSWKALWWLT